MAEMIEGLAIREPWIGLLLSGRKTWEMRARPESYRGWIGLIRSKSDRVKTSSLKTGCVSGIARLDDVGDRLSPDEMVETFDKHRVPEEMIRGEDFKWFTPWKLTDIRKLREPVPYDHPNGAVLLFDLDPEVRQAIFAQIDDS